MAGGGEGAELRGWTLSSRPVGPGSAEWSHLWSSFSLTKKWGDLPQEALKRTRLTAGRSEGLQAPATPPHSRGSQHSLQF